MAHTVIAEEGSAGRIERAIFAGTIRQPVRIGCSRRCDPRGTWIRGTRVDVRVVVIVRDRVSRIGRIFRFAVERGWMVVDRAIAGRSAKGRVRDGKRCIDRSRSRHHDILCRCSRRRADRGGCNASSGTQSSNSLCKKRVGGERRFYCHGVELSVWVTLPLNCCTAETFQFLSSAPRDCCGILPGNRSRDIAATRMIGTMDAVLDASFAAPSRVGFSMQAAPKPGSAEFLAQC
jgi:hypothetical protein